MYHRRPQEDAAIIRVHFCKSCGRFWFHSDIVTHIVYEVVYDILPRGRRWKTASVLRFSCKIKYIKIKCPVSSFASSSFILFWHEYSVYPWAAWTNGKVWGGQARFLRELPQVLTRHSPWHHRVSPHLESEATPRAVWSLPCTGSSHVKHTKYTSPNAKRGVHLPHQLANLRGGSISGYQVYTVSLGTLAWAVFSNPDFLGHGDCCLA